MHMVATRICCQSAMQGDMHMVATRLCCQSATQGDMHMVASRLGYQSAAQGDMHMVASRLGYQSAMIGTGWTNSCPGCMDTATLRFISGREGCLGSERVFDNREC